MSTPDKFTPGPWRWAGEDYRGGWGWQLLVNASGEGVLCGEGKDGPYKHLPAFMPIARKFCKTGMHADGESAPCVHVRQADANLIAAAPDLLASARAAIEYDTAIRSCANSPDRMSSYCSAQGDDLDALYAKWIVLSRAALARAEGRP